MSSAKPKCCYIFTKNGEQKPCTANVVGRRILSTRDRELGVVCDTKGYTGSNQYCVKHQIFEDWWAVCRGCGHDQVAWYAKGTNAGLCYICIKTIEENKVGDLKPPPVEESNEWTRVVSKNAPLAKVKVVIPASNVKITETAEIKAAKATAEQKEAEAHAARQILIAAIKVEESKAENSRAQAKYDAELRSQWSKFIKQTHPIELIQRLLDEADY